MAFKNELLIWKWEEVSYPIIAVDNKGGALISDGPVQVRIQDESYISNVKYCLGFSIWGSRDYISIGVVYGGSLFSLSSETIEDFFSISVSGEAKFSPSIISALQVGYDTIYIGAAMVYNESVMYVGKIVNVRGLAINSRLSVIGYGSADNDIRESPKDTGENSGDMEVSYSGYNESSGFGSVSNHSNIEKNNLSKISEKTVNDLAGLIPGFVKLDGCVWVESFQDHDNIYYVQVSQADISVDVFSNLSKTGGLKSSLTSDICINDVSNVYQSRIVILPKKKFDKNDFSMIYTPTAIFTRFTSVSGAAIVLPTNDGFDSIKIEVTEEDPYFEIKEPIGKDVDGGCGQLNFIFDSNAIIMNEKEHYEDEILVRYAGSTINVPTSITGSIARSVSLFIPYSRSE